MALQLWLWLLPPLLALVLLALLPQGAHRWLLPQGAHGAAGAAATGALLPQGAHRWLLHGMHACDASGACTCNPFCVSGKA